VVIDAASARVAVRGRRDGVPAGKDDGRAHRSDRGVPHDKRRQQIRRRNDYLPNGQS
jgi:hypothetical protein